MSTPSESSRVEAISLCGKLADWAEVAGILLAGQP